MDGDTNSARSTAAEHAALRAELTAAIAARDAAHAEATQLRAEIERLRQECQALAGVADSERYTTRGRTFQQRVDPLLDATGRPDGASGVGLASTEQLAAARELQVRDAQLRTALDLVPFACAIFDADLRISFVNTQTTLLVGRSRDELIGKSDPEILPPETVAVLAPLVQAARDSGTIQSRQVTVTMNKREVPANVTYLPQFDQQGQLHSILVMAEDLTEQRRMETALRESEQRFGLIAEHVDEVFWIANPDLSGFTYVNPAYERVFGHFPASLIADPTSYRQMVLPEDQATIAAAGLATAHTSAECQYRISHPAGATRWLWERVQPLFAADGTLSARIGVVRDITAWKEAELALRMSEARFRAVFEHSGFGIATGTLDWGFMLVNPAYHAMLGYNPEELQQISITDLTHPEDMHREYALALELLEGKRSRYVIEKRYRHKAGHYILCQLTATALRDEQGQPVGGLVMVEDISERRAAEEERRRIEYKLHEAQRLESIGVLAGGIAHDFNNLLTGIIGHAELALLELPAAAPARDNLVAVIAGARHAAALTSQLLAYAGRGNFVSQPLSLNQLVRDMSDLLRVSIDRQCRLHFDLSADLPLVNADSAQLRQVVLNLLINAAEAIGETGGAITIATSAGRLTRDALDQLTFGKQLAPGSYACLAVSDTGSGMDNATLARIFDPFFTTKFAGRGLGLASVQGMVRQHNGALHVTSTPGHGTTFRIWLPAIERDSDQHAANKPRVDTVGYGTVLVVDDEAAVRTVAYRMLEHLGYQVELADDGTAALDRVRGGISHLSAVLLDLTMPDIRGDAVAREIQLLQPGAPIVLMSGYNSEELMQRYGEVGVKAVLQKPFTLHDLQAAVARAIAGSPTG